MRFRDLEPELIEKIKIECELQGSNFDINADTISDSDYGGFDWHKSTEPDFWSDVLGLSNENIIDYDRFYEKYPKKNSLIVEKFENDVYYAEVKGKKVKITIEYLNE